MTDLRSTWGGGTWNQDDVILFADRAVGLLRVPASGGVPVPITAFDPARLETDHDFPSFLPDGRHFVYVRRSSDARKSAVYLGSVDARPEQQSSKPLVNSTAHTECSPSADPGICYLLFVRGSTLMAQPFNIRRLELTGQAAPVAEQLNDGRAFSSSANNVLVFQPSPASEQQLTWYDREGKALGTAGDPGDYQSLALSPDGTRLAVTTGLAGPVGLAAPGPANIGLLDLSAGGASTRFTFGSARNTNPVWSPDGSRIVFRSNRDGPFDLYLKPANGAKDEEVLLKSGEDKTATSWSRDGRFLLYTVTHHTKTDIWVLPLDGDRKPLPYLISEFNESQASFSPDGHWVAYTSNESGQNEVYVRSFSINSGGRAVEAGGKWQISVGSGQYPHWRGDGRELYYRSPLVGRMMAVEIATSPAFRAGRPQPLAGVPSATGPLAGAWDSSVDGRRFIAWVLMSGPQPYTVVLNWQAGLKK